MPIEPADFAEAIEIANAAGDTEKVTQLAARLRASQAPAQQPQPQPRQLTEQEAQYQAAEAFLAQINRAREKSGWTSTPLTTEGER